MIDYPRGYVLDSGFLVFGDGMIRIELVQHIHAPVGSQYALVRTVGDYGSQEFRKMSEDQESHYQPMDSVCFESLCGYQLSPSADPETKP